MLVAWVVDVVVASARCAFAFPDQGNWFSCAGHTRIVVTSLSRVCLKFMIVLSCTVVFSRVLHEWTQSSVFKPFFRQRNVLLQNPRRQRWRFRLKNVLKTLAPNFPKDHVVIVAVAAFWSSWQLIFKTVWTRCYFHRMFLTVFITLDNSICNFNLYVKAPFCSLWGSSRRRQYFVCWRLELKQRWR